MSEEQLKVEQEHEIRGLIREGKVKVVLWPVIVATFPYGFWIFKHPRILEGYDVYAHIADMTNSYVIGAVFMLIALLLSVLSFRNTEGKRDVLLLIAICALLFIWIGFTVAFLLATPPNTVWIFSALMAYLSFEVARRV